MTNDILFGLLGFEEAIDFVEIKKQQKLTGHDAVFIVADLHYDGTILTVPFVYYLGEDWIFTPCDWQGWVPDTTDGIKDITWRVNDTDTEAVMFGGLPRLASWTPTPKDLNREIRKHIGRQLLDARKAAGLSIQKAADLSGIDKNLICRMENGRYNPGIDTVNSLARIYGLKLTLMKS